jgi:hypothetical protein
VYVLQKLLRYVILTNGLLGCDVEDYGLNLHQFESLKSHIILLYNAILTAEVNATSNEK